VRFKEFLLREAKHREDISIEKAEELLRAHCSDALSHQEPMWRGSKKAAEDAYIMNPEASDRSSAHTTNYYTIIMDHFLGSKGWPKRSKSIICTNNKGKDYAESYVGNNSGGLYAIFPYNGVKVGVCGAHDIWELQITVGGATRPKTLERWNNLYEDCGLADYSFEDFVQSIKDTLDNPEDENFSQVEDIFGGHSVSTIEDVLEAAYTPPELQVSLATTANLHKYEDKERECWVSGKCVAVIDHVWEQIKAKL